MKRLIQLVIVATTLQGVCHADVTRLPSDDGQRLREVARFHPLDSGKKLPGPVFALCADENGRLGEPGQNWEATDVIADETQPRKRLIWAVTDGGYYVVHYERGGRGHSFHFLVTKLATGGSQPSLVWRGVGERLKDYKAFLDAVARNKIDDKLQYAH